MILHYDMPEGADMGAREPRRPRGAVKPVHEVDASVKPDDLYLEALQGSRYVRLMGPDFYLLRLDFGVPEDRALHDAIVRDEQERRDLRRAQPEAAGVQRDYIDQRVRFLDDRIDRFVDVIYGLSRRAVATIKQAAGEPASDHANPGQDVTELSSDALWACLEGAERGADWIAALGELAQREDPGLAGYVVEQLQVADLSAEARNALIFTAEECPCYRKSMRAALKDALLDQALRMRDADEQKPLWAAVRRYASLVPLDEVNALRSFLRDADALETKQVALQGIRSIFAVEIADEREAVAALRSRVHELAEVLIDRSCLGVSGGPALALQAFCAAASLVVPGLPALADRIVALERQYVRRRAEQQLQSLSTLWAGADGERAQRARRDFNEAMARLRSERGPS